MILYQIANAAVQLSEIELNNALDQVNCSTEERNKLSAALSLYRLNGSHLMLKKRHPILLILDEVVFIKFKKKIHINWLLFLQHLECLPWESIPCLKRHPMSRVSSVHIVHMLYNKHKDSIQNGLM